MLEPTSGQGAICRLIGSDLLQNRIITARVGDHIDSIDDDSRKLRLRIAQDLSFDLLAELGVNDLHIADAASQVDPLALQELFEQLLLVLVLRVIVVSSTFP